MRKLFASICAATMAMTAVATTSVSTSAAPVVPQVRGDVAASDVVKVDHRRWHRRGYYRYNDNNYYNGYRGYRDYRRGYRRYNDFWFPAGAFVAGAIIGSALNDGPRYSTRRVYRRGGNAHVQWCYDRYRSYRAYDNTYQPYSAPRRQCYSPYS